MAFVLMGAVLAPTVAEACSCGRGPVCAELWQAEVVFIGLAGRVTKLKPGSERTDFLVQEVLRGQQVGSKLQVEAHGLGGSCDRSFDQGTRYLVFASRREDRTWRVMLCSNTEGVDRVPSADLAYIRRVLATPTPATLAGSAVVRSSRPGKPAAPLAGARIVLRAGRREIVTRTDENGGYKFDGLTPGDYAIEVQAPAGVEPIAAARITVGSGACAYHMVEARSR
jgi:hypothetical protein